MNDVTITLSRTAERATKCEDPFVDITVALALRGGQWFIKQTLDEDGGEVILSPTEVHLAKCLAEAGVDETGR
mgnify:CR=1 FL=1